MLLVVLVLTLVGPAVGPSEDAGAVHLVALPLPDVAPAVGPLARQKKSMHCEMNTPQTMVKKSSI